MDARVDARLPGELLGRLDAEAGRARRRRSEMVRLLIEEALDARDAGMVPVGPRTAAVVAAGGAGAPVGAPVGHPFKPQKLNALKCAECGGKAGDHRG